MPLKEYKDKGLLFNQNFLEQSSEAGLYGYRGELVLIEGEVGDDKGHTKPPVEVMRGAVILADDKLQMVIGALDQLAMLNTFFAKYRGDFAEQIKMLFFVVDITRPMQVNIDGIDVILIPLVQGVPWNEIIDELALEKSDFKGQSPADKIRTVYQEMQSYKPGYAAVALHDALAATQDIKREAWGAV